MSNLLDKASIILTPTAYDNSKVLCVKPSDGSGDFDFSRNSAATRVNAQGLVENVQSLGSEEIVNGNFATDLSGWSSITNVSWSSNFGGSAFMNANGTNAQFRQFITYVVGKTYKISWEVKENNGCDLFRVYNNGGFTNITDNFVGTHTIDFTQTSGTLFLLRNDTIGSNITIDNVSVKEVIDNTNIPRINYEGFSYDGSGNVVPDSGCGSWLWEPQSTNLITQSELFSDASWDKVQTTIEAASITLPNGLTNGYKLFANTTLTSHWLEKTPFPTATTGQDYTLSLFVKSAGSDFIQVASSTGFPSKYQNFNISTGTKASGNISDSSITDFGNGWYRISVTETTTATTARYLIVPILSDVGRNAAFAGTANEDGVYIWGAMLEQNSFSTSYIPTEGSTVTRNQDLCTNGGSLASINSTEGTLYFEGSVPVDGTFRTVSLAENNLSSNAIWFYISNQNRIQVNVRSTGNPSVGLASDTTVLAPNENFKVAVKYKVNDIAVWLNGVEIMTDNTASVPLANTLNNLSFKIGTSSNLFFGKTKCVAVWKEALTDAELTELTTV